MALKYCIRFSGAGGYGLIQAARILAEAAAIYDNKNAAESCSYGPEARGSSSRADLIISDKAIDYPKAKTIDFLLALTQEAYDKHIESLRPDGTAIVDSSIDIGDEKKNRKFYLVSFEDVARDENIQLSMINMIALGFFAKISNVISDISIRQAILARIPKKSEELYLNAFEAGLSIEAKKIYG